MLRAGTGGLPAAVRRPRRGEGRGPADVPGPWPAGNVPSHGIDPVTTSASRRAPTASDGAGTTSAEPDQVDRWALRRPDGTIATGWFLLPLRLFLGVTFLFAGCQKLANPNFFRSSSPTSIHAQLVGAEHSSPIHGLLSHLVSIAPAVGLVIALGEVAIGLGVLVGLWVRVAAVAGMALSFGLFLTASFHSSPYYTGSDIVFFFAWTPLALAGAAGAPALDTWLARPDAAAADRPGGLARRDVLSKGAVAGLVAGAFVVASGLVAALGRLIGGAPATTQGSNTLTGGGAAPPTTSAGTSTTSGTGATPTPVAEPKGTAVGPASGVPVGGSASFTDPGSGDPALVIQQTAGDFVAFDAICPHQGCTVAYQAASRIIACPCHGSEFNARTGNVINGPATSGLTSIKVAEGANGNLYVRK
jgi:thiosulfate dehydrogenase (quinone) large subunit